MKLKLQLADVEEEGGKRCGNALCCGMYKDASRWDRMLNGCGKEKEEKPY